MAISPSQRTPTVPRAICPRVIHSNENRRGGHPRAILSRETVGAVPVCPPERPHSGVSIPKYICTSRIMDEDLTMDAPLAGRHGRAHRHRPYQTPSYFSVQSAHNQRPLRPRSYKTIHCLEMNERTNLPHYIMLGIHFYSDSVPTSII